VLRLRTGRRGPRIVWGEADMGRMERVLGEHAAKGSAPLVASILRAAVKRGARLDAPLAQHLQAVERTVKLARHLAGQLDAPARNHLEARAFPHQRAALRFFEQMHALGWSSFLLCDEPGVGKTLAAILYALSLLGERARGGKHIRVLIVAPNAAKRQWRRELKRYLGTITRVTIVEGTIDEQSQRIVAKRGWIAGHWESLVHARDAYSDVAWDVVIADESQLMTNRDAQRTQTMHALNARYKIALTGHPFTRTVDQLWSILHWLYPDVYSSFWLFFNMHVKWVPEGVFGGRRVVGARQPKLLKWELAPFVLRRTKAQVFPHLPPITRVAREVELSARGRREYEKLKREFFVELEALGGETKILPILGELPRLTRLRQYLVDPALIGAREPSVKYPQLLELVEFLDAPLVIFSSFAEAVKNLAAFLAKRKKRVAMLHGKINARERERNRVRFLRGDFHALIVQTQLGGRALNMGKYGYVAHLDLPFTKEALEQSEDRVNRPEEGTGKLVPTTAYRVVVADTYEERLQHKLEERHRMFGEVFGVGELRKLFS
jgi:SNF2 family DNA or RNA helicase